MIKVEEGRTEVSGSRIDVAEELTLLLAALKEHDFFSWEIIDCIVDVAKHSFDKIPDDLMDRLMGEFENHFAKTSLEEKESEDGNRG